MRSEGYCSWSVCVCVCLSVKQHLTYGASVRPENAVTYSAGNEGQKFCGVFSETAPLQRSGTSCIVCLCAVGHFPAESARAHCSMYHVVDRSGHFFLCGGVRRRRSSFVSCHSPCQAKEPICKLALAYLDSSAYLGGARNCSAGRVSTPACYLVV